MTEELRAESAGQTSEQFWHLLPDGFPFAGEIDFLSTARCVPGIGGKVEVTGGELAAFGLPGRGLAGAGEAGVVTRGLDLSQIFQDALHGAVTAGGFGGFALLTIEHAQGAIEAQIFGSILQCELQGIDTALLGGE